MKFFNWMHGKINGGQGNKKQNGVPTANHIQQEIPKEEFSDWPNGLLAIGTFGNVGLEENQNQTQTQTVANARIEENLNLSPDLTEFTEQEVGHLQKELQKLLTKKTATKAKTEMADLPLDRFLNCPSSLEVDRRFSGRFSTNSDNIDEEEIYRTIQIILGKCKSVQENKRKSIGKKSVSFLVKKLFAFRSGFAPTPSLRDPFPESRMEKLLRTMLSKKIYSQNNSSQASSSRKFIEEKHRPRVEKEEERQKLADRDEGGKWVKTDSEFIVLEI